MADSSTEREERITDQIRDAQIREDQILIDSLTIDVNDDVNLHDVSNTYNSDGNPVRPGPAEAQAVNQES